MYKESLTRECCERRFTKIYNHTSWMYVDNLRKHHDTTDNRESQKIPQFRLK